VQQVVLIAAGSARSGRRRVASLTDEFAAPSMQAMVEDLELPSRRLFEMCSVAGRPDNGSKARRLAGAGADLAQDSERWARAAAALYYQRHLELWTSHRRRARARQALPRLGRRRSPVPDRWETGAFSRRNAELPFFDYLKQATSSTRAAD